MPDPRPARLTCVDAHQLLFRAWYGFPARITSRDKERDLTGVFGFFALLRAGLRDNISEPTEVLVVFDGEDGAAKRKAIDPGYKANRPEGTPPPIKSLADVKRGLDTCGIRWAEIEDEEADDAIATIATIAGSRPVTIMSGDKDYYQLLTRRVSILNTARKPGQRTIGPADIEARYGITASQWCDFRALVGDPSDGLPGISGIGPKTAARLLAGGLALDDLPLSGRLAGRTGKAVLDGWEQLLVTRNLIRMNADIPLPNPPTGRTSPQFPPAAAIVEELGLW
jgi:DNA polymerase I